MDIIWDNPSALYWLWLLLPAAALRIWAHHKRREAARRFADPRMGERLMPALASARPWVRGTLFLAALLCAGVAFARPRWGVYFENVTQRGADVMVILDVSRSMLSEDVSPSRLERAKSDIRDLLQELRGERVGLVAFAGKANVVCPLTVDHGFYQSVLEDVGPQSAPRGGTLIGDAIREALGAMDERRDRDQALLVITDGEDQDSYPREAAQAAADRGVVIFTVGLGDPDVGSRIPVRDGSGNLTYLKHEGQEVWSKMDERLLREMALATGGAYVPARTQHYDLGEMYRENLATLSGGEVEAKKRKRYRERFQIFLGLAIAFFLLERLVSPYPKRNSGARAQVAALLVGLSLVTASEGAATDAPEKVQEAVERFRDGELEEAMRLLQEADLVRPEDSVIDFDRGVVHQAQGEVEDARTLYQDAATARDALVAVGARYNLGTLEVQQAQAVFGENPEEAAPEAREQGLGHLGRAIAHFRSVLELDPEHGDARHNLEMLRLWVKHMDDVWRQRDREKEREEKDLIAFLEMLRDRENALRKRGAGLAPETDSPRKREPRPSARCRPARAR